MSALPGCGDARQRPSRGPGGGGDHGTRAIQMPEETVVADVYHVWRREGNGRKPKGLWRRSEHLGDLNGLWSRGGNGQEERSKGMGPSGPDRGPQGVTGGRH